MMHCKDCKYSIKETIETIGKGITFIYACELFENGAFECDLVGEK